MVANSGLHDLPDVSSGDWVRGWAEIAKIVGWSEKTVRHKSQWGVENRLPVSEDHIGPIAQISALRRWMLDQLMPAGVRGRMRRRR